jgi:hypothetical protein
VLMINAFISFIPSCTFYRTMFSWDAV